MTTSSPITTQTNHYTASQHTATIRYLVASPDHDRKLSQISIDQWANVLLVIQDRVRWLYTQKSVTYVAIYVDSGLKAGTSINHPHLNIVTFATIPPTIEVEAEASHRYMNENGSCPACNIISTESSGPRQILQVQIHFISFSPWAPTYPYEFWIYPKRHTTAFSKSTRRR